jgi:tetratricopeptide (TPR) repeat protein
MRLRIYEAALFGLLVATLPATAQQNSSLQPLFQALRQQGLGGGQYEGTFTPTPQQMLERVNRSTIQELASASNALVRNPNDVKALVQRAVAADDASMASLYRSFWLHFAAKDLERALRIDPNNFPAHHYYGDVCFRVGDSNDAQPVMHLAVTHFTKAIQLQPNSARTYMGRGWAYLMMDDQAHARADFNKALQLDPSLRPQLVREANSIMQTRRQKGCVQAMLQRMGAYVVNRNARTASQCADVKGYWTGSECRISTAMAPGPILAGPQDSKTANAGLGAGNCAPPPNAVDDRYDPRAGGYVVR